MTVRNATLGVAAAVLAGLMTTSGAGAAVGLSDNFHSYTNGNLSGQSGWTPTALVAAGPFIQVTGTPDKVASLTTGQDEYKAFTSAVPHTDGNSLLSSLAVNVSAVSATGDYFSHLSSPVGTTSLFYQRLFARSSGAGYQIGLVDTSG